ncbi:AAA family ATPase [Rouxiella sp. T17]|uniref:AAA family ATPase n=1 Tax=Rouxiella sp. T17 TaxID=3085684 RepID=UPI002FCC772A
MKIQHITLTNFRLFKSFECSFESDLTVLVGVNGQGKTTLLDSLAIALGQFVGGFGPGIDKGIIDGDIRLAKITTEWNSQPEQNASYGGYQMEQQLPVSINVIAFPDDQLSFKKWSRQRNTLKGRTTLVKELKNLASELQTAVQQGQKVTLPLIAYYGTGRLWGQKRLSGFAHSQNKADSRLYGYSDCLDPSSSYTAFSTWLRKQTLSEFEFQLSQKELENPISETPRSNWIESIRKAVDIILESTGWKNVRYSAIHQAVVVTHSEYGDHPVSSLSDGLRNTIGMVADIAYRAILLNPHFLKNAVTKTPGIVLIDEVDMHLHPEWQQMILTQLSRGFPNLQFIVTTHSPQVLSTVKRHQIRLITHQQGIGTGTLPVGETLAEASNDLLERVMKVSPRPPLPQVELFEKYMLMIDRGLFDSPEAQNLRDKLLSILGPEHEDIRRSDRAIARKRRLG